MPRKITYPEIYEIVKSTLAAFAMAPTSYVISGTVTIDLKKYQDAVLKLDFKEFVDTALSIGTTSTNVGDLNKIFNINQNKENIYVPDADGGSLFLNGDRIIINSKKDFSMLFGKKGVAIASPERVNIDAGSSITLFSPENLYLGLPNKGQKIDGVQKTQKQLGGTTKGDPTPDYAYEPLVLGIKLANLLEDIIVAVTTGDMVGGLSDASWQPSTIAEFELLANRLPEIISTYAYVDGISHSQINEETLSMLKAKQKATKPYVPPTTLTATVVGQITPPLRLEGGNPDSWGPAGAIGQNTIVAGGGGFVNDPSTQKFVTANMGGVYPAQMYSDGTFAIRSVTDNGTRSWLKPNQSFVAGLAKITLPLQGGKTTTVSVHPQFAKALEPALAEIVANGGGEYIKNSAGALAIRNVTNGTRLSNHSYGFAFDINTKETGFAYGTKAWDFVNQTAGGKPWTDFQRGFYEKVGSVMIKHGITWLYKMDPMHFSIHE